MRGPKRIGGYTEVAIIEPREIIGAWIKAYYSERCGYIESYREERQARRENQEDL